MMTREQRLAEGWEEMWCCYDHLDGRWQGTNGGWYKKGEGPGRRLTTLSEALGAASLTEWPLDSAITARPAWRRRKPKAPPPLQVGDEVWVRATVAPDHGGAAGNTTLHLRLLSGYQQTTWVKPSDVERVKP